MARTLILPLALVALLTSTACAQTPDGWTTPARTHVHDLDHDHEPPTATRRLAPEGLTPEERTTATVYAENLPSVVTIQTVSRAIGGAGDLAQGLGTGVVISDDHHVLTAAHVVDGAELIAVKAQDGQVREAELVFSEPAADIALIRLVDPIPGLPHATLGDSDRLAVGQRTYIIGNPRGLEATLTVGTISAFRDFGSLYDGSVRAEFIQTDAAINSGNSGGPMFDSRGRVIGIASRILTQSGGSEGLGFVVAINTAKQLLALEDRQWTGLDGVFLSSEELATLMNLDLPGALLVQRVAKGSPAERAGLRGGTVPGRIGTRDVILGGDLIVELGGQEACHAECLVKAHEALMSRGVVHVVFMRRGQVEQVDMDVSDSRRNFLSATDR